MKQTNLVFSLILNSIFLHTGAYAQDRVYLNPCLKVCIILCADNSASMDSAISDMHRTARRMLLIPGRNGSVETGLYSFDDCAHTWCKPTSKRQVLMQAVDSLCVQSTGNATEPDHVLKEIRELLAERLEEDSTERQVLIIHSDYHWQRFPESVMEINKLVRNGVVILLTLPQKYDKQPQERYDIHEEKLNILVNDSRCINLRSSFQALVTFLEKLPAKNPCW